MGSERGRLSWEDAWRLIDRAAPSDDPVNVVTYVNRPADPARGVLFQ
jgi:hypothetical protein